MGDDNLLDISKQIRDKRTADLLKKTGPHGLTDAEYQARENMRSPEGSRSRTTQEYINNLEAKFKSRIGKPELVNPEEGMAQVGALAGAVLPIAVHYANQATHGEFNPLDIKSAGEGSDIVPRGPEDQQYNSLQEMYRQKKLQSLK